MFVELQVPEENSNLNNCVEEYFNISSLVGKNCEEGCKNFVEAEKRTRLTRIVDTEFFIVVLTRGTQTLEGTVFNSNRTVATDDVVLM